MLKQKNLTYLSWRKAAILASTTALIFSLLELSPAVEIFDSRIISPMEFKVRSLLGRAPQVDPRIKIYNYDDLTAFYLEKDDLRIHDWATVIEVLDKRKPRAIFIDKIFSLPIGKNYDEPISEEEAQSFTKRMKEIQTPIYVGSSVAQSPIKNRKTIDPHRSEYLLTNYLEDKNLDSDLSDLDWMKLRVKYVYGPHPKIVDAFTRIGHLNHEGYGKIFPFIRLGVDVAIPHAALLAGGQVKFDEGVLKLNGHEVGLDNEDRIPINFSNTTSYNTRAKNLFSLLVKINLKGALEDIKEDDVVVILPLMYTGNVDYKDTPIGRLQGGFFNVALINSALTGRWIKVVGGGVIWIILAALWSMFFSNFFRLSFFWGLLASSIVALVAGGLLSFAFLDVRIPWFLPLNSLVATSILVFAVRVKTVEKETKELKEALQGSLSPEQLDQILRNPNLLRSEPTEEIVTIVFVDIVNFSLLTERLSPIEAFNHLRKILRIVTETVHKHGGIIDKTLGDGVLCFFGYKFAGMEAAKNHADQALQAAIEIQQKSVNAFTGENETDMPAVPLRVGINTAGVFIGDIGDTRRIDFTVIGRGVNYAQRLEAACEPFKIMMGSGTRDLLTTIDLKTEPIYKRHIQIKHHDSLFEAHEFDPFLENPSALRAAREKFRQFAQHERKAERWDVINNGELKLETEVGTFEIKDFSYTGLGIEASLFFAKGVVLKGSIVAPTSQQNKRLMDTGLMPFHCEVRWGDVNSHNGKFRHGLAYKGLNRDQCEIIFNICREVDHRRKGFVAG